MQIKNDFFYLFLQKIILFGLNDLQVAEKLKYILMKNFIFYSQINVGTIIFSWQTKCKNILLQKTNKFLILILFLSYMSFGQTNGRPVLAYFPSWSESGAGTDQNSKLREIPEFVNYVFLSFAKPNLRYEAGSYDISQTGLQVPYDGCALKESVSALKDKGINIILSIGGETYWQLPDSYNIEYQQIKDLVDDIGFVGIDWDYEPDGSFANIGSAENVQHFIDFFNNSRDIMPASEGYILACAPSGVGALGGIHNNDSESPFAFANRNELTGENDDSLYIAAAVTNGINLFGFSATGHMIPVLQSVGNKIDLIAFQGYNVGGSTNRSIMYDAYAYYAEIYDFMIVAGVHFPPEPWGPFYEYTHENVASLSSHILHYPQRVDDKDGIMIWQLLLAGSSSSAYSYMNVGSLVLNDSSETYAIQNANNYSLSPYTGGAAGCDSTAGNTYCGFPAYNASVTYSTANSQVYYDCKIWHNQWWANPNEIPGENPVWVVDTICNEGEGCDGNFSFENSDLGNIELYPNPSSNVIKISGLTKKLNFEIYNLFGIVILDGTIANNENIDIRNLPNGLYFINFNNRRTVKFIKE